MIKGGLGGSWQGLAQSTAHGNSRGDGHRSRVAERGALGMGHGARGAGCNAQISEQGGDGVLEVRGTTEYKAKNMVYGASNAEREVPGADMLSFDNSF